MGARGGTEHHGGFEKLRSSRSGHKQVLRGLKSESLARVYVANDADTFLYQRIVRAAEAAQVPVVRVPTMKELGAACGVEVASAAAGIAK